MRANRRPRTSIAPLVAAHQLQTLTGRSRALLSGRASAALCAALMVVDVRGKPVLIPANTCCAVLWAVLLAGGLPYLADIDPATGNVTPETLSAAERSIGKAAAVIACHLYGVPAPMRAITAWAAQRGAFVIEDSALALGTLCDDRPVGSWGDVSLFSFGLGKIVDVGNGGALLSDDPALADEIERVMKAYPVWNARLTALTEQWCDLYWALHRFERATPELNGLYPRLFGLYAETLTYRLAADAWRALPDALDGLPENLAHRRTLAHAYSCALGTGESSSAALWRFPVFVEPARRDTILRDLWSRGAHDVTCWYPSLGAMRAVLAPDLPPNDTPRADAWGASVINLPLDASTTPERADRTAAWVRENMSR
jgi:dTDP-4-amino-4,6-dideoxygalactose transaminase